MKKLALEFRGADGRWRVIGEFNNISHAEATAIHGRFSEWRVIDNRSLHVEKWEQTNPTPRTSRRQDMQRRRNLFELATNNIREVSLSIDEFVVDRSDISWQEEGF